MAEASSSVEESQQSSNEKKNGSPAPPTLRRPTNRLRDLFPKYRFPRDFEEYELSEPLESLTFSQVADVLDDIEYWWLHGIVVWISETAFLILNYDYRPKLPRKAYKGPQMEVDIYSRERSTQRRAKCFAIYEQSPQKADSCLMRLLSLEDDGKYIITTILGGCRKGWRLNAPAQQIVSCPLHPRTISTILPRTDLRWGTFENMVFNAEQCQALVNSIQKDRDLKLKKCLFSDGGISFVTSLIEKKEDRPTIFHAADILPLDHVQLRRLLQVGCIKQVMLHEIYLDQTATPILTEFISDIDRLYLGSCIFADGGQVLAEALKAGQGPRNDLCMQYTLDTVENWSRFLSSLTNVPTKKLDLCFTTFPHGASQLCSVFVEALVKNVHVREVRLNGVPRDLSDQTKRYHANSLAKAILENCTLEKLKVCEFLRINDFDGRHLFDKEIWKQDIEPRLEANRINRYRKLFNDLAKSNSGGAVVGTALNRVRHDSSLLFMILTQNSEEIGRNASGVTISTSKKRTANAAELQQDDGKTPKKESRTTG